MDKRFSTFLLDNILEQEKKEREELRLQLIEILFKTFDKLSHEIPIKEAYLFGSITKSYKFQKDSDVDIGFIGLKDEHFLRQCLLFQEKLVER